jgi:hypothetical protein
MFDLEHCQAIWLAVLSDGVNCALGKALVLSDADQQDAIDWLGSKDFEEVCGYAGADPEQVLHHVSRLWNSHARFEVEVW